MLMPITIRDLEEFENGLPEVEGPFEYVDDVLRVAVDLLDNGEPWYLIIGPNSIDTTVPRENDPKMKEIRNVVERLCRFITMQQASFNYLRMLEDEPEHE